MSTALAQRKDTVAIFACLVAAASGGALFALLGARFSPMLAGAAVGGVLIGMVLVRYPDLALYFTVALIPIERFGRFTDDNTHLTISLMRIMGLVALGILILHRLARQRPLTFGPPFYLYSGYVAMGVLSIAYTEDTLGTVRGASTVVGNLLFFFVLINMITTRKHIFFSLVIWLAVSLLIGAYSVYDWHLGSGRSAATQITDDIDPGRGAQTTANRWSTVWSDRAELETLGGSLRRSMGSTSHAAVYGINCILTIPLLLYGFRLPLSRVWKGLLGLALVLILYNTLLTNTRAAILLAVGIVALCCIRGLFRVRPSHILVGLIGFGSLLTFVPQDVYARILDISNYSWENSASLRIRAEYVQAGIRAISENWLYGSGLASEHIVPKYLNSWSVAPEGTTVHNEYLQTFMELGIVGFFFHFAFVGLILYYSFAAARQLAGNPEMNQEYWLMIAIQIAMISVLIFGVQLDVFHFPLKGWWLLAGITVAMYGISRHEGDSRAGGRPSELESK